MNSPKILYLDISPQTNDFKENYSINGSSYGGGAVIGRWAKEMLNFDILAEKECFNEVSKTERLDRCKVISRKDLDRIILGQPLIKIFPESINYDIILASNVGTFINLKGNNKSKLATWVSGFLEAIHPEYEHLFCYNSYQYPKISNKNINLYKIQLGKKIEPWNGDFDKKDYIFQCNRQCELFNSALIARSCRVAKIRGIFAGKIEKGYEEAFFSEIDNKYTFYIGNISENLKNQYNKEARLSTYLHNWPTPFSLSAIESLSFGTPVASTGFGFWSSLIKEGINGFYTDDNNSLVKAYEKSFDIKQKDCYDSVSHFNIENMIKSIELACLGVLNKTFNKNRQKELLIKYKSEINDSAKLIDPFDKYNWGSLTLGWALAQGLSIKDSHKFLELLKKEANLK